MSVAEVFEEVKRWSPAQRKDLLGHLKILELISDPDYMAEIGRRLDAMLAGDFVTSEEFRAHMEKRGISLKKAAAHFTA